jgi:hypothetical protein
MGAGSEGVAVMCYEIDCDYCLLSEVGGRLWMAVQM